MYGHHPNHNGVGNNDNMPPPGPQQGNGNHGGSFGIAPMSADGMMPPMGGGNNSGNYGNNPSPSSMGFGSGPSTGRGGSNNGRGGGGGNNGGVVMPPLGNTIDQMFGNMFAANNSNSNGNSSSLGAMGGAFANMPAAAGGGLAAPPSGNGMGMNGSGNHHPHPMDAMLGTRRGSMDSNPVLDPCIIDLTRRRMSFAGSVGSNNGNNNMNGSASDGLESVVDGGMGGGPSPNGGNHNNFGGGNAAAALQQAQARQQQWEEIRAQQTELELKKRELEMRQQMLRQQYGNMTVSGGGPASMGGPGGGAMGGMNPFACPMASNSMMMGTGGMHQPGGATSTMTAHDATGSSGGGGGGGGGGQKWWICNVCNSQAFASKSEALAHETLCQARAVAAGNAGALPFGGPAGGGALAEGFYNPAMAKGPAPFGGMTPMGPPSSSMNVTSQSQAQDMDESQFTVMTQPLSLSLESDKDWLTPLHCFVRKHCVQVFCASTQDVATPSKGKRKPIQVGQVGIRCPHCHNSEGSRERGSVYFPTTISSIYNATMNLLQRHLHSCSAVPEEVMRRYQTLKSDDARSGTSKKYWVESALSLGLVDTPNGIRVSARNPPSFPRKPNGGDPQRNSNEYPSNIIDLVDRMGGNSGNNGGGSGGDDHGKDHGGRDSSSSSTTKVGTGPEPKSSTPLVTEEDKPYATAFSYHLLSQMQSCVFTEADRLGKRKGLPAGFAGLACRHCFGGYGSGRFFPSSIKTLSDTSKTLNVLHNHMQRCRKCPQDVRDQLEKLRAHHDDERAKMKFGSQKAFFAKIWARLHDGNDPSGATSSGSTTAATRRGSSMEEGGSSDISLGKRKFGQYGDPSSPNKGGAATSKEVRAAAAAVAAGMMQHQHSAAMAAMMGVGGPGLMGSMAMGMGGGANVFNNMMAAAAGTPTGLQPPLMGGGGGLDVLASQAQQQEQQQHHLQHNPFGGDPTGVQSHMSKRHRGM